MLVRELENRPGTVGPDPCSLPAGSVLIALSRHSVARYQERVRPGLDHHLAHTDLKRLMQLGEVTNRPPSWLARREAQRAAFYLTIGDVVLPLDPCRRDRDQLVALTCIARGGLSDAARANRNLRRHPQPLGPAERRRQPETELRLKETA
jgi:hypothetical protein